MANICGGLLCILMIASDYHGFTTEMAIVEFKGEVLKKSFSKLGKFYCSTINYFNCFLPDSKK